MKIALHIKIRTYDQSDIYVQYAQDASTLLKSGYKPFAYLLQISTYDCTAIVESSYNYLIMVSIPHRAIFVYIIMGQHTCCNRASRNRFLSTEYSYGYRNAELFEWSATNEEREGNIEIEFEFFRYLIYPSFLNALAVTCLN